MAATISTSMSKFALLIRDEAVRSIHRIRRQHVARSENDS
jgi:hypothetical protein